MENNSKCNCSALISCKACGEEKNLDGDFWINKQVPLKTHVIGTGNKGSTSGNNICFLSDIKNLENDLLLTINGSVLGKYTKEEIEKRLSNILKQLEKLKDFNIR